MGILNPADFCDDVELYEIKADLICCIMAFLYWLRMVQLAKQRKEKETAC